MPVIYSNIEKTIEEILQMRKEGSLRIPRHQRGYCWDGDRQMEFIDTIRRGLPIPCICLYLDARKTLWIEDGQQRITTIERYFGDKFHDKNKLFYRDLVDIQRHEFLKYRIPVLEFKNATPRERIEIFDRFQNGLSLSTGERYNSLRFISPLVQFTCEQLLTPEEGVYARAAPLGGMRQIEDASDDDEERALDGSKRFTVLKQAVALCAGLLWGSSVITEKYDYLREYLYKEPTEQQKTKAKTILDRVLKVYERAEVFPMNGPIVLKTQQILNNQWKIGNFTGYLIHTFWTEDATKWDAVTEKWAHFIADYRRNPAILKERLHAKSKDFKGERGRLDLNEERWKRGCMEILK